MALQQSSPTLVLQSGVPSPHPSDAIFCIGAILSGGVVGFLAGLLGRSRGYDGRYNTVMAARVAANETPRPALPSAPSGVLTGCVGTFLAGWGLHCRAALLYEHPLFSTALVLCASSSGAWLTIAASIRNAVEQERHARIEAFIADPAAPVPAPVPGIESMPPWFALWSRINVGVFLSLMGWLLLLLLHHWPAGQPGAPS